MPIKAEEGSFPDRHRVLASVRTEEAPVEQRDPGFADRNDGAVDESRSGRKLRQRPLGFLAQAVHDHDARASGAALSTARFSRRASFFTSAAPSTVL